ncbi:glycoside hydrolase family 18 protein [Chitinophaga agri]|uniref:GH18 domain-containing protein n=1 Tax=Chitinophaga agri TaxID=2703787 RepID=A0A6B9ZNF8_9BACT|nr:hypothetical protein [Chitinophaga agri]QHS63536.1 hypothetical protein GWR21_29325 [Chitinophaga agri]
MRLIILAAGLFGLGLTVYFVKDRFKTNRTILGQQNAIWSESIYFRGHQPTTKVPLGDQYIQDYAGVLKANNIKYAYFYAGPIGKDGHLPAYVFSDTARASIRKFRQLYPELIILPWCGGIQHKTIYLEDSTWRITAIGDLKRMIDTLGVTGVHLDFEYFMPQYQHLDSAVAPGNAGEMAAYPGYVNQFHRQLRDSLPQAFISSVVTSTCPASIHWKRKTSLDELRGLLPYVDQISFLFYDMNIHDSIAFRQCAIQQVKDLQELKKTHPVQMLIAIATFQNTPEYREFHDMKVENIINTLSTLRDVEAMIKPDRGIIDGISIYCGWETNINEWEDIANNWTQYHE